MTLTPWLIATATAGITAYGTAAPTSCMWGRIVSHGPRDSKRVALTFDDGPTLGATDAVLDILRDAGVRASFFVVGSNVDREPEIIRRMAGEGHLVANHTWSHSHYGTFHGKAYWRAEIDRTDDLIVRLTGKRPTMFRPPMGLKTPLTMRAAEETGHATITWSRRTMDGVATTPDRICQRLSELRGGDIVLMHDGIQPNRRRDPQPTIAALPRVIEWIRGKGLEMVGVDDLLTK